MLWPFPAPDPDRYYRWRVQLDCAWIMELLTPDDCTPPSERQWRGLGDGEALPPGQVYCQHDDSADAPYRDIVEWGDRQEVSFPADPVEPPEWADADVTPRITSSLAHARRPADHRWGDGTDGDLRLGPHARDHPVSRAHIPLAARTDQIPFQPRRRHSFGEKHPAFHPGLTNAFPPGVPTALLPILTPAEQARSCVSSEVLQAVSRGWRRIPCRMTGLRRVW